MLRNQRPYQLMMSKSNNRFMSMAVAIAAKVLGCSSAFVLSIIKRKRLKKRSKAELLKKANEIFPKPLPCSYNQTDFAKGDPNIAVSVVVPIYNAEKYIKECVESILNQKTACNVQVILVNDGSTDGTAQILGGYKNIPNVICVDNADTGSAAKARNFGISLATGRYIMFVDSDDVLLPDAIENLFQAGLLFDADIVQGGWKYLYEDGQYGLSQIYAEGLYVNEKREAVLDLPGMPWGKIFKRELFEDIRFPDNFTCFEDAVIQFLVFRRAERISAVSKCVYGWRKNPDGLTGTSQNTAKALQSYWIVEEMLDMDARLNLPRNEIFKRSLVMQLSNYCYACIRNWNTKEQEVAFELCADLYNQYSADTNCKKLPYAMRLAHKALVNYDFGAWCNQGKFFSLIR